jgi:hypothetical protein
MTDINRENKPAGNDHQFRTTGSDKANQLGPSSPAERTTNHPQAEGAASSADNDMDRQTNTQSNLEPDAEEAQSDGNLSFPEGK